MSGRIRQLKPVVFLDEELWALIEEHPDLHLLQAFEGLWCQSDREGRFEWRPAMLKTQILPYWGGDFARCLDALCLGGFVLRYEVDGRAYGQVRTFSRHQRPNNREPESVIPPPSLEQTEVSLEHAQASHSVGHLGAHEPRASAPRASLPPLPTPTPTPKSQPTRAERPDQSRPPRTVSLPSEVPTQGYLDAAAMAGVSREQATSTWEHYFGAGLPDRGVEKLVPWMVKRAKERANQTARLPRAGPEDRLQRQADRVQMLREQEAEEERRAAAGGVSS
jgi:hypothetical protein